jgi:hypothetical protein
LLKDLDALAPAFPRVQFYKLNAGKCDKEFAHNLRLRSLPTTKIFYRCVKD